MKLSAHKITRLFASAAAATCVLASAPAGAQFVLGGPSDDDAYVMCTAWVGDSNVLLGSGEVANNPDAKSRFHYYADKYGEETGQKIFSDCESYTRITPEWRARWDVGSSFVNDEGRSFTIEKAPFLPEDWATTATPEEKEKDRLAATAKTEKPAGKTASAGTSAKSAAQVAAEERAARAAEREASNKRQREEYERVLAEHEKQIKAFEQAQQDVAAKKAQQAAEADAAAAEFRKQQDAYFASIREHDAQVAKYESELAAQKVRADFDKRNGLGKASTATDANRCVTTPETRLNASFKGNTAASVMNGCGEPVDIRICLMTAKGWNCGVTWGLASQAKWSFSSFGATGPVFMDAKTSASAGSLRSPQ